jgi:hypothetical protein
MSREDGAVHQNASPSKFLNDRRLRDYPRLVFISLLLATIFILATRNGWQDAQGNIFGNDFLMLYSGGILYQEQPAELYSFLKHAEVQAALVAPTPMSGAIPYNYPPYVAALMQRITFLPLAWAFLAWTVATIVLTALAASWASQSIAPQWLRDAGLSRAQMIILVLSSFPFIEGLKVGQNHGVTFFLFTGVLIASLSGRSWLAGALAAMTAYKPQVALGFLLIWLVWRDYKALLGYGIVAGVWGGLTLWERGWGIFQMYIDYLPTMLKMPYLENYATYLMMTPYGFLLAILPSPAWQGIVTFTNGLAVLSTAGLAWFAFRLRNAPLPARLPVFALALLYPLLATPQVLLHDTLPLALFLLLWARTERTPHLLVAAIVLYVGSFLLTPASYFLWIPLMSLFPSLLTLRYLKHAWENVHAPVPSAYD